MKILKRISVLTISLALLLLALIGCQSSSQSKGKIKVVAGTSGVSNPFSYEDNGTLTGYDVALLEAVFKGSDKYELEWQKLEFPAILSGLDSGRLTVGAITSLLIRNVESAMLY